MEFATIGSALSSRRKTLNIDQARAAAIIGMSRTTFSSYERDLQRPSAEVLPSLAEFLEISIEDILTLYGGTCIAALRPSLEQFLAAHDADGSDPPSVKDAAPLSSTPDPIRSIAPAAPTDTADDSGESAAPVGDEDDNVATTADPIAPDAPAASKDTSVSIFANELSDEVPRPSASTSEVGGDPRPTSTSTSDSSDSDRREPKASKGKDGKKKKGKKGKRAKS
jgi:transcriptional regulator with XRE-family HTH domain